MTQEQSSLTNREFQQCSGRIRTILFVIVLIFSLVLVGILVLALRLSKQIISPIDRMVIYAGSIAAGNFGSKDISETNLEEIQILSDTLNELKHKINFMINDLKRQSGLELRLQKSETEYLQVSNELKNTELKMLQAQINPHFLFNTLNSISRLALISGNQEVVNLVDALSNMMRYNLNKINRPITLKEELNNLKDYVYIQQIRYRDKLHIDYDIHSDYLDIQVPCLILQPLVENSIVHGLKPYNYEGNVRIEICDSDDTTIVRIIDNGVGMPEDTARILSGAAEEAEPEHGPKYASIGYRNVARRLEMFFAAENCITLSSQEGEGTTISLYLPHIKQEGGK